MLAIPASLSTPDARPDMRGLSVNGFVIVETLGSGQGGILYLARDASGREAVVRVARDSEDQLSVRLFHEEAVKLLPAIDEVGPATGSDGRRLLVATAPSTGNGFTQHAVTQRLAVSEPQVPPANRLLVLAALLGLAAVAGVGTFVWLSGSHREASPTPVAKTVEPIVAVVEVREQPLDAGVIPAPVVALVAPSPARPPSVPKAVIDCTPDDAWRKRMNLDLADLEAKANAMSPVEVEKAVQRLYTDMKDAKSPKECEAIEQRFEQLLRRAISTPVPRAARPVRTCEPDQRWRDMMMLNLDELEAKANAMDPVVVSREVMRIGQATVDAKTPEQCGRVVDDFEAVVKRAIK